jgi:hypothetical protein
MRDEHQVPIWFFIGGLLLVYGIIITGAGLYGLSHPTQVQISLAKSNPQASWFFFHPDIWWGVLLTLLGAYYCLRFYPGRRQNGRQSPP